jgi:phosphopantetheinyl transferase
VLSLEGRIRNVELDVIRRCEDCGEYGHGAPKISGATLFVSSSRAGDLVVTAITEAGPLGIDLARPVTPTEARDLRDEVLSQREHAHVDGHTNPREAFSAIWARKEAVVESVRTGIGDALPALDVLDAHVSAATRDGVVREIRVMSSDVLSPVALADAVVDAEEVNVRLRSLPEGS